MKFLRIILNVVIAILLVAGAVLVTRWLIAHRRQPAESPPRVVVPKVLAPALQARLNQRTEIVGYGAARPRYKLEITAQVTGIVVEKAENFLSGKYVSKDQLLLRIEEIDYQLAVEQVEKNIEMLKAQLQRLEQEEANLQESRRIETERRDLANKQVEKVTKLVERNAASDNELDLARETLLAREVQLQNIINQLLLIQPQRIQVEADMASARVQLKQAQINLNRCVIKSPFAGQVLSCQTEIGEQVVAGASCGEIYGTDLMEVPLSVPSGDLEWIDLAFLEARQNPQTRDSIEARVERERPGRGQTVTWKGRVDRIEAGLEAETRLAVLVVQVNNPRTKNSSWNSADAGEANSGEPGPNEGRPMLEVNMFCKVTILGRQLAKAYVLPRSAILPDGSVYVVVDGRLARKPVEVARYTSEEVIILPDGGIADGDRVVVASIPKPVLGMAVQAVVSLQLGSDAKP